MGFRDESQWKGQLFPSAQRAEEVKERATYGRSSHRQWKWTREGKSSQKLSSLRENSFSRHLEAGARCKEPSCIWVMFISPFLVFVFHKSLFCLTGDSSMKSFNVLCINSHTLLMFAHMGTLGSRQRLKWPTVCWSDWTLNCTEVWVSNKRPNSTVFKHQAVARRAVTLINESSGFKVLQDGMIWPRSIYCWAVKLPLVQS